MGSLFASLLNSAGALRVYERAFNVIQNNITNANSPGYVKQDQALLAMPFDPASGITGGVMSGPMQSSRSAYLEQAVRQQTSLFSDQKQTLDDLSQVEALFDVSGNSGVPAALIAFFDSFSQLSVNPNDSVARQTVIDTARQVAEAFHSNADGLATARSNVDNEILGSVNAINAAAAQIAELNRHVRSNTASAGDAGLDAQLHATLEGLSGIVDFTVIKAPDGSFGVFLGGQTPLVIGDHAFPISADFSTPQAAIRDAQGNDFTGQLQGAGGALGGMLQVKNVILPDYSAKLDALAQNFADSVNAGLAQGLDRNGVAPTVNLFSYNAAAGAAFTLGVTNITADQIAAASAGAPGGNGNALALAKLATTPAANGFTFMQAYGNLAGGVGRDVAHARQETSARQDLVNQAKLRRGDVSGVSLDEEAAKLLQFQQAYQAVGKMVGILNSLTDTVLHMID